MGGRARRAGPGEGRGRAGPVNLATTFLGLPPSRTVTTDILVTHLQHKPSGYGILEASDFNPNSSQLAATQVTPTQRDVRL